MNLTGLAIPGGLGLWLRLGGAVVLLVAAFASGCQVQSWRDGEAIARKDAALQQSETSLRAAAGALRAQKVAAEAAIAEERANQGRALEAAALAEEARVLAESNLEELRRARVAASKRPKCRELLRTDLLQTCGIR